MGTLSLVAFDLDGTLSESKQKVPHYIVEQLIDLLRLVPVCIISGGKIDQFQENLLNQFPPLANLSNLHIMPTSGTQYYRFVDGKLQRIYAHSIAENDAQRIAWEIERRARELGFWETDVFGPRIENRGSQITFSALGQLAPVALKQAWDPGGHKREALRAVLAMDLSDFRVASGGLTSVDITIRGVDKAFGLSQLALKTGLDIEGFIFVGDRLDSGGNDYPVKKLGIKTVAVDGPKATKLFVEGLVLGLQADTN
jgi:HAD superfamily hydrolase (TIGR01484 family)